MPHLADLHLGVLFVLGIGVFGGILGAWLFQRLKIPQVVGYIAIGLLIGQSGLGIITADDVDSLRLLTMFAIGVIGLLVGGELHGSTFKQYGRQFAAVLLAEGTAAFLLVGVGCGAVVYAVTQSLPAALASGIVLGAISSATDPASTMEVLWEYRARGILTTAIIAIVALDDALAMTLYGFGTAIAGILTGEGASIAEAAKKIGVELFGAVALGVVAGLVLNFILKYVNQSEKSLALAIGTTLLVIATAAAMGMDVILATMAIGVTLVNIAPVRSKELFGIVRSFATPVYVIFFVFVGARLSLPNMPPWLWAIVLIYVAGRTIGKMGGTWLGAKASGAHASIRKYGGMGLFAQGGVAVGLSVMASQHLGEIEVMDGFKMGDMVIFTVTATTLIVQVIGPPLVKLSIRLADEIGRNVTEEDVIAQMTVREVVTSDLRHVSEAEPVRQILAEFARNDHLVYPVVNQAGKIVGIVTLDGIKSVLASQETWEWLVAADVMLPADRTVRLGTPLKDALDVMRRQRLEQIPVLDDAQDLKPAGILDTRKVHILVEEALLARREGK